MSHSSRSTRNLERAYERTGVQQVGRVFAEASRQRREQRTDAATGEPVAEQWPDARTQAIEAGVLTPRTVGTDSRPTDNRFQGPRRRRMNPLFSD
jgi:hypothetical protein